MKGFQDENLMLISFKHSTTLGNRSLGQKSHKVYLVCLRGTP